MHEQPLSRARLSAFLNVTERGLAAVLRDMKIRLVGGRTKWPVVWKSLGLGPDQDPDHHPDLTASLMTADEVASYCGVSSRTVYRWSAGKGCPAGLPPMPRAIDLSAGRKGARKSRWRRAEIRAWQTGEPQPVYARPAPVFGSLKPLR